MSNTHDMIRDAKVEVTVIHNERGDDCAHITVNDTHEHTFGPNSRVTAQLQLIDPEELGSRLTGGSFFFVEDQLIDFKDNRYGGFIHDDASIQSLMDVIGYSTLTTRADRAGHRMLNRTQSNDIALAADWSKVDIQLPIINEGGDFTSKLKYTWNPYTKHVNSIFMLVRLICTNGMVGTTPFVNMTIPLVNRWEEHLDIASMQLQNKITGMMAKRLEQMTMSRSSVGDLQLLDRHIASRLESKHSLNDNAKLHNMLQIVDPYAHLTQYYKTDVLDNKSVAAQLPSHLTLFDTWNLATELCTHFTPADGSTDTGLQKFANQMVFDRDCSTNDARGLGKQIKVSPFSNPERAFFGDVTV